MGYCMYCGKPTKIEGWVDIDLVGWGPNCWGLDCEERAMEDAERQRRAMKEHDGK